VRIRSNSAPPEEIADRATTDGFTRGYLRTRPVPLRESAIPPDGPVPALPVDSGEKPEHQAEAEESFANLIPLRDFPETLYVAPALSKTRKQSWFLLNRRAPRKTPDYVPGSWTLFEGNLYSLVDPERSRLKSIIDVGGVGTV
jgi:hypothetical protein